MGYDSWLQSGPGGPDDDGLCADECPQCGTYRDCEECREEARRAAENIFDPPDDEYIDDRDGPAADRMAP